MIRAAASRSRFVGSTSTRHVIWNLVLLSFGCQLSTKSRRSCFAGTGSAASSNERRLSGMGYKRLNDLIWRGTAVMGAGRKQPVGLQAREAQDHAQS